MFYLEDVWSDRIHEDDAVYTGLYQINGETTSLRPGFCGSQCFCVVYATGRRGLDNAWITQVAMSYNNPSGNGGVAIRTRTGILQDNPDKSKLWTAWRYIYRN